MNYAEWLEKNVELSKAWVETTIKVAEFNMNTAMMITEATRRNTENIIKTTTNIVVSMVPKSEKETISN